MLKLADLKDMSDEEVLKHIAEEYAGEESGVTASYPDEETKAQLLAHLETVEVLIAYESVGMWGCDSSSFFLLRKPDGSLSEVNGSHCSCYGFEGQWDETEVLPEALKQKDWECILGGYDDEGTKNAEAIKAFVREQL